MESFHGLFWTFWLRAGQAAVGASPTLLAGVLLAGLTRRFVGEHQLRSLFGGGPLAGVLRAWALAMAVPVCSFGVLPVACELRRARVQTPAVVTFLLAAPAFHLWSLIYGLTAMPLSGWAGVLLASLFTSTAVGLLADARRRRRPVRGPDTDDARINRSDRWWLDVAVGAAGAGLLAALLPAGAIERRVCEASPWNIGRLALVMLPAWVSPEANVVHIREALRIAALPGAAVPIALLGGGSSLAAWCWVSRRLGAAVLLRTLPAWIILAVLAGLGLNRALAGLPEGTPETHGFDALTRPYHPPHTMAEGWDQLRDGLRSSIGLAEATAVAGLAVCGAAAGRRRRHPPQADATHGGLGRVCERTVLNQPLSGRARAVAGLAMAAACAVVGLYVHFPPVDDTLEDIDQLQTDVFVAVRMGEPDGALRKLTELERLAGRLRTSAVLRFRHSPPAGRRVAELRAVVDDLKRALAEGEEARSRALLLAMHARLVACREAYRSRWALR